jgi:benzoyl-CoA reductase/2-hydroxyglutaryl-CoA dehydratase subunit BcrC/BadD/HgdB
MWGGAETPPHVKYGLFAAWPGRRETPTAFDYFADRAAEVGATEALQQARPQGRKVVGVLCTFIPEELILALNAVPVRLCGGPLSARAAAGLPRDTCPVIQAALQRLEGEPLRGLIDAVVVPRTCDWKVQAANRLPPDLPVFRVELSAADDPRALQRELRHLADAVAEVTDFSLTAPSLRDALAGTARARQAHRQLERLRGAPLPPLSGCEAMLVADAYAYGDLAGWTEACEQLATALSCESPPQPEDGRPRIVLSGSPIIWPNFKVPFLVEDTGGVVVGDDFCSRASRLAFPGVEPGSVDDVLGSLARRALEPCTCGTVPVGARRQQALLAQVRSLDATGVVCHYLRGCAPVASAQASVVGALKEARVPTLVIETDAGEEDFEGLRTRIEAFIEMARQQ